MIVFLFSFKYLKTYRENSYVILQNKFSINRKDECLGHYQKERTGCRVMTEVKPCCANWYSQGSHLKTLCVGNVPFESKRAWVKSCPFAFKGNVKNTKFFKRWPLRVPICPRGFNFGHHTTTGSFLLVGS